MTALETRFDTILPTLATKEDLKNVEIAFKNVEINFKNMDLKITNLELKLTHTIHREITSSMWKMIGWMTAVMVMGFTGVFYIARYVAPI